jgi:hypothetical protein
MKDLILILGMFAAGILGLVFGIQGILYLLGGEGLLGMTFLAGSSLAISQVIVIEFVAKRIHEPPRSDAASFYCPPQEFA